MRIRFGFSAAERENANSAKRVRRKSFMRGMSLTIEFWLNK
jgi:hypothetical protein